MPEWVQVIHLESAPSVDREGDTPNHLDVAIDAPTTRGPEDRLNRCLPKFISRHPLHYAIKLWQDALHVRKNICSNPVGAESVQAWDEHLQAREETPNSAEHPLSSAEEEWEKWHSLKT